MKLGLIGEILDLFMDVWNTWVKPHCYFTTALLGPFSVLYPISKGIVWEYLFEDDIKDLSLWDIICIHCGYLNKDSFEKMSDKKVKYA